MLFFTLEKESDLKILNHWNNNSKPGQVKTNDKNSSFTSYYFINEIMNEKYIPRLNAHISITIFSSVL